MKIKNISKRRFCHARLDDAYKLEMLILKPDEVAEVPDEVAKSWLKTGEVVEFVEPKDAKKLVDENKELKEELEKLKKNTEKVKEEKVETKKTKSTTKKKSK